MATRSRNIARYLTITMTQGSADAFVQGTVDTGIIPEQGLGLQVVAMELIFASALQGVSADFEMTWSLTRDTKLAVTAYSDQECILFDGQAGSLTTSGQILVPYRFAYPAIEGIYLVEPTIYGQLDSSATGLTLTAYWRLYYQEVALSEVDILRVLNNS
jgi:hypothetical protein